MTVGGGVIMTLASEIHTRTHGPNIRVSQPLLKGALDGPVMYRYTDARLCDRQ